MSSLVDVLKNLGDLVSPYDVTAPAVDGINDGQIYIQVGDVSELYRKSIWLWDGTAWNWIAGSVLLGSENPNGVFVPDGIGQQFKNTVTGLTYIAQGLTNNDWGVNS